MSSLSQLQSHPRAPVPLLHLLHVLHLLHLLHPELDSSAAALMTWPCMVTAPMSHRLRRPGHTSYSELTRPAGPALDLAPGVAG